jgi:hypothetical protein
MSHSNHHSSVWVLAIHDRAQQGFLAFDTHDILECLFPTIESCQWIAFDLDFTDEPHVAEGELLSTGALLERLKKTVQTVEGKFLAYNERPDPAKARWDYAHFPESHTVLGVVAVDSSYFEVYTKNIDHIRLLKARFLDVREENPAQFFLEKPN